MSGRKSTRLLSNGYQIIWFKLDIEILNFLQIWNVQIFAVQFLPSKNVLWRLKPYYCSSSCNLLKLLERIFWFFYERWLAHFLGHESCYFCFFRVLAFLPFNKWLKRVNRFAFLISVIINKWVPALNTSWSISNQLKMQRRQINHFLLFFARENRGQQNNRIR